MTPITGVTPNTDHQYARAKYLYMGGRRLPLLITLEPHDNNRDNYILTKIQAANQWERPRPRQTSARLNCISFTLFGDLVLASLNLIVRIRSEHP
ncbi:hypothetical protein F5Y10DRAFT_269246 [Nemania abortiva]|nr:hypothetical protein F5Y10DRAFT_269246 [Nemania abortiva]